MKKINRKITSFKKRIISIMVILIFILFILLVITKYNRNYFIIESFIKNIYYYVYDYVDKNTYSKNNYDDNFNSSKIEYLTSENNKLKDALNLKGTNNSYVVSKIINRNVSSWFNKVSINKGKAEDIKNNLPVINNDGLVGFVTKSSTHVSEVTLLTSINDSNMQPVIISTSNGYVSGVLKKYDGKNNLFLVSDVMSKNDIKPGDKVMLSDYNNDSYNGIYVGMVVKEESSNYGLSRNVWIESMVNFDDLLYLVVCL